MTEKSITGHRIISLTDRCKLEADGIDGIISFEDDYIRLLSELGILNIEGEALVIESLNKENKKISITGNISGIFYTLEKKKKNRWGAEK